MGRSVSRINPWAAAFLAGAALALGVSGCATGQERKQSKEWSTLRLYLEAESEDSAKTTVVPVYRKKPILVRIFKEPILDEGHVVSASVVNVLGGFAIRVQYDFHGTLRLEEASNYYRGRRLVIHSYFPEGRWLAAPTLSRPITDGVIVFTPDATREEAERIVLGLNNLARKLGSQPKKRK